MKRRVRAVLAVLLGLGACKPAKRDFYATGPAPPEDAAAASNDVGSGVTQSASNVAAPDAEANDTDSGRTDEGSVTTGREPDVTDTGTLDVTDTGTLDVTDTGTLDVVTNSCASHWAAGYLVVDDFSDSCSRDHWQVRNLSALHEPLVLDVLQLELLANAPEPLKRWWGSENGTYVYRNVDSGGFVVRAEVHLASNRLDGQPTAGQYQVGGLLVTVEDEFTGDWILNGVGFVNGSGRDCPTDNDSASVGNGFLGVLSEWAESTSCVVPSQVTRAELALCRYRERVVAYQRPLEQDALGDAGWAVVHSGRIESLGGQLRVGMAVSVETQEVPEVVARFPWVSIDTGINSFADCSVENFQARYGTYGVPTR